MEETQEESYARPGIFQTELVEELWRESIWKDFAMIHQKLRINEEMSPAHFAQVWDICESILHCLSMKTDQTSLVLSITLRASAHTNMQVTILAQTDT